MTLDIIGKVDRFGKIFDIDYFKKHREDAYFEILKTKDGDTKEDNAIFAKDLYYRALKEGLIPEAAMVLYRKHLKEQKKQK